MVIQATGRVSSLGQLENAKLDVVMEPNFDLYPCIVKYPTDLLHKVRAAPIGRYHVRQLNSEHKLVDTITRKQTSTCVRAAPAKTLVKTGDRPRTDQLYAAGHENSTWRCLCTSRNVFFCFCLSTDRYITEIQPYTMEQRLKLI